MEDIHEEEVVVETPYEEEEICTRQEEEEVSLKEPSRKAIMEEPIPIPFSSMIKKAKKTPEFDLNMLQVFKKVEVTIPLLDAIQQIPKYAKFLKDLCTHKDRIGKLETLSLGSSISSLMKPIPEKCGDPGPCLMSCRIGGVTFHDCMCDLGACVSIMTLSIFARLNLAPLKRSAAKFVLADKSVITVMGIAEDVLVEIKDLVFPVDFYILEMPPTDNRSSSSVLLGRPFLKTSKFKLDAFTGTYSFEVGNKTIKFNLEEAMRHPPEEHSVLRCDVIDEVVAEVQREDHNKLCYLIVEEKDEQEKVDENELHELSEKEPQLEAKNELKPLPSHLKYAFLEDNQRFSVIIASVLSSQEEGKLLEVLRKHKKVIGWSLADIVGIDPRMCMHRIFLQEGAQPVRQPQRRLNPMILDVVKKEVTRLLDAGIIYLISDSEWVSPVQVFPKKSGITAVKKDDGEVVTTRVQNVWRVCIDYRKLNTATRKDHYPLPFIDQMLDRLAVFMDDFSVYGTSFDSCLENLAKVLERCVNTNLVLNFEKYHFMVRQDIVLGHIVSGKSIFVDLAKVDVITSLHHPSSVRECIKFMGPFPNLSGYMYILLAVDYVSKWVEVIPTCLDDANTVVSFIRNNIVCHYGSPRAIVSDQGSHFCNRKVEALLKRTAYKTPLGMSPFRIVYGKACYLLVEIEHRAYWVVKQCNMDITNAGLLDFVNVVTCYDIHVDFIDLGMDELVTMATKKGKEKASNNPTTKRAPQRSTTKARPTPQAKPLSKRVQKIIHIDKQEKGNPARDPTRFSNRFCELMFPAMIERSYHSEYLLAPPEHIVQFVMPRIERRQWDF
ncbi:uncharacterized protein [Arachis hypogaea]|uniref:uncharacterized protein n=1 Tax=Arachis hypogaea TaxID=3818 RepID=UPI003B20E891